MTYDQLISHYGSGTRAAEAIGVTHQYVYQWRRTGIPWQYQCVIEVVSGQALLADKRPESSAA